VLLHLQRLRRVRGAVWRAGVRCAAIALLTAAPTSAQTAVVPAYFGIQPGAATKAQVELLRGEPLRRLSDKELLYEYAPARGDNDSARLVVSFDPDSLLVARIDVYLKAPTLAEPLRERFGTRILSRDREDGGREELFFPQLQGLIFASRAADAPAVAVSFLGRRTLGRLYAERADAMMARNELEEARTEADKAVAIDPDGGEGYLAQGRYFLAQKHWDEAIVRFTAASTAKYGADDRYRGRLAVARIYAENKSFPDRAATEFQAAIAAAPPNLRAQAFIAYGRFLDGQKKPDEAIAEYQKAVDADRNSLAASEALANALWTKQDHARALPVYQALSQHADKTPTYSGAALAHFRYAYALQETGKPQEAIAPYQKLLGNGEFKPNALNNLGVIAENAKNWSAAVDYYQQAVQAAPTVARYNLNLAQALNGAGRFADAERQGQTALKLKADDGETLFTIAQSWAGLKKKKETLIWLRRAVDAGFKNRSRLTGDTYLAFIQNDGDFKKLLLQVG
jgi:tetratricopeptide (TPR) repeat protein